MTTLRDLTSFPIVELELPEEKHLWEFFQKKYLNDQTDILVSVSNVGKTYKIQKNGLVRGIFYSLVNMFHFIDEFGKEIKLMKLKSTNNESEWNGDYGDYSNKWSRKLRNQVGAKVRQDGEFFMTFTDFLHNFKYVIICF